MERKETGRARGKGLGAGEEDGSQVEAANRNMGSRERVLVVGSLGIEGAGCQGALPHLGSRCLHVLKWVRMQKLLFVLFVLSMCTILTHASFVAKSN